MSRRFVALFIGLLDAIAAVAAGYVYFFSNPEPATSGLDQGAGVIVTALFLVTGAPALVLAGMGRAPRTALILAFAFPAAFALFFALAVGYFTLA
jgi:hypothetical protein